MNREQLQVFVCDVVEYATKGQLNEDNLEYKITSSGQQDVAVFDFTSIKKAESAARIIERKGSKLLVGLVGDSLLEVSIIYPCSPSIIGHFGLLFIYHHSL